MEKTILSLRDAERDHILKVCKAMGWNYTKAAIVLEINYLTLRNKLKKYRAEGFTVIRNRNPVVSCGVARVKRNWALEDARRRQLAAFAVKALADDTGDIEAKKEEERKLLELLG